MSRQELSVGAKLKVINQGQGQISRTKFSEMAIAGAFVFHKHIMQTQLLSRNIVVL